MKPLDGLRRLPIEIAPAPMLRERIRGRVMAIMNAPVPASPEAPRARRAVTQPTSMGLGARFSLVAVFSGLVGATVAMAAPKLASRLSDALQSHRTPAVASSARELAPLHATGISARVQEPLSTAVRIAPPRLSLGASQFTTAKTPGREQAESLASERALLDLARGQLVAGQPGLALETVERHRARFAAGSLAEEREALAIIALAKQGAQGEARERTAQFKAAYPNSFLRKTLEASLVE